MPLTTMLPRRSTSLLLLLVASAACGADAIRPSPDAVPFGGSPGAPGGWAGTAGGAGTAVGAGPGGSAGSSSEAGSAGTSAAGGAGASGETAAGGGLAVAGSGGVGGNAENAGASGAGAGPVGPQGECPTDLPGAKLVRVTRADGRAACIDQREVTQGEYHAFIEAVGKEGFQKMGCPKDSIQYEMPEPSDQHDDLWIYYSCSPFGYDPDQKAQLPMGCVFTCQAAAYCAWAGKELCGGFDDGERMAAEDAADPQKSIWASACTNGGTTERSHASDEANACGEPLGPTEHVASSTDQQPACHGQGDYAGIFGLSGGVGELLNAGDEFAPGKVRWSMGGPLVGVQGAESPCGVPNNISNAWGIGFRCCKRVPKL